jgi:subtilisin family serine protease/subtilisin-like proprotein convertase family protein
MRLQPRTWLVISVLSLVGAAVFWRLGEQRMSRGNGRVTPAATGGLPATASARAFSNAAVSTMAPDRAPALPMAIRQAASNGVPSATPVSAKARQAALRLRNSDRSIDELMRDGKALLLRNAVIDTASGIALAIPDSLKAEPEPGAFVVQAEGAITPAFRAAIDRSGAIYVSYLPNNAYLVRATSAQADSLRSIVGISAVLPYEPYFKLEPTLLEKAIDGRPADDQARLNVTVLPGARDEAVTDLRALGVEVVGEYRTPFGPALVVEPASVALAAIARVPAVQGIELARKRQLLNDLARVRLGVSGATNAPGSFTNHLGLTGTNVFININDSGIDPTHPDLEGRITSDVPSTLVDLDGHGTHVAGTILGSGKMSSTVSNAPGSILPGADFRGMAPAATAFALPIDLTTGPLLSDAYLQEVAATNYYVTLGRTNLPISNNSWGYTFSTDYDSGAASYDAAVRDALPQNPGAQPILYVFAAGNEGFGEDNGQGGEPGSIRSPATAKNVITVGAIESPRNITNEVYFPDENGDLQTNQVFLGETDTDYQVTSFSSRGNVEPGVEGLFGRFKPDVVAPGAFTISTRGKDWLDPRAFFASRVARYVDQFAQPDQTRYYSLFVPTQASEFRIRLLPNFRSPDPFPTLPLYLKYGDLPSTGDGAGSGNLIRVPPDDTLQEGDWYFGVGNNTASTIAYDIQTVVTLTNDFGNYFDQLKLLNDGVGPHYRYESGTSMAAPAVTGLLALFAEYFERENRPTTPALMKALLINGARSLGSLYNFNLGAVFNLQGWGFVNITNSLPAGEIGSPTGRVHAVQYTDQTGTNALITGQSRTWTVAVDPAARDQILKVTLVWTDPPGNPSAGIKLVNDLDLKVRNEETKEDYLGNDIPFGSDYNVARPEDAGGTNDVVNNVENILLRPPLSTNYTITVHAKRVAVNAVTTHPSDVVQDFALVASVNDPSKTNALTITRQTQDVMAVGAPLYLATNGVPVLAKRVGASPERFGRTAGFTNQWAFFVFTNLQKYTPENVGLTNGSNVAFITFLPPNLGKPRYAQGDIDLYVSQNSALTNLDPAVVSSALKSTKQGGTESIFFTNSVEGSVYYIGVKSEDQQAVEFGFVTLSSNLPFDEDDGLGNRIVRGMPFNVAIPDGSPDQPQAAYIFGLATRPMIVQKVVVTNTLRFDGTGDLLGNLGHNNQFAVLYNHNLDPSASGRIFTGVFDDSDSGTANYGSIVATPTDGPGSLNSFIGEEASGPWILSVVDNALTQNATNVSFSLLITPQLEEGEFLQITLLPNSSMIFPITVPPNGTNLIVTVQNITPTVPLFVALRRGEEPTFDSYDKAMTTSGSAGEFNLSRRDVPPLNPGRYYLGVFNRNAVSVSAEVRYVIERGSEIAADRSFGSTLPIAIGDDAIRYSSLYVPDDREIVDVKVGLRVDHPRVSDLAFHVTSPAGTRLLISENRGGPDGTAYGATTTLKKTFTTFTDDTNLTTTPIKYGIAPFTNSAAQSFASNRIVFASGFEEAAARLYNFGEGFPLGWVVVQGAASVVRPPIGEEVPEGQQYLMLSSSGISAVSTNVLLAQGQYYRIRFAVGRTLSGVPQGISVYVNGIFQQELLGDTHTVGWYRDAFIFRAPANSCRIEFRSTPGRAPLAIDNVVLEEEDPAFNAYYLPEEPLKPFTESAFSSDRGVKLPERALGTWTLEVADTRAGPANAGSGQYDWRLEFIYALPTIEAIRLTNNVPYFGAVGGDEVRYFYTEVPSCATEAFNILAGPYATLLLFGDHDGLPLADINSFGDDYGPYLNFEPGGIAQFTLSTNFPAPAPLRPGQRYYLAVRNFQPDLTNNAFGIMVSFDCEDPPLPVVDSLFSGIPRTNSIPPGPVLQYYQFVVSSNAIRADFELTPNNGNVDLYVRYGRVDDYPLPSTSRFDYKSDDPNPATTDFVSIDRTSTPIALTPGVWYVAIRNGETFPVDYTVKATEFTTQIITLTNGIPYQSSIDPIDPAVGLTGDDLQFYAFLVSSNSIRANFETLGASGDVNLYVRKGLPIPTPADFHFAGQNPGAADEFIAVTNTTTPVWLSPGWWFLAVENADFTNVTYSIQATEFPATIIPLTNNVAFTNIIAPGVALDYYSFLVSTQALGARFEVFGMSDDVQLLVRQALPVPTFNDFNYASTNVGLANEEIVLTPYSFPTTLTPGNWYLSIANASSNNASYIVRAIEETAVVIPLTNGVPYNASLPPGPGVDYYQFTISSNATAAEFKVTSAGTGDLDLFLKKGPPLPNALNSTYSSVGNGVVDEVIQIDTNSFPVPVGPGTWFLMVTNKELATVSYEITATEFGVEPPPISGQVTNLVVTPTNVCITWISIPGTNYYVVAKSNALDAAWTPVSPTLLAVDTSSTWCLEPPGPWRFFDVFEGESPVLPIPAPVPVIRLDGTNICVSWASVVGTNYFVQGKKSFTDPNWDTLTPLITATGPNTEICYPIAWGYRFFRVGVGAQEVPVPTPVPADLLGVEVTVDSICLTWPTKAGLDYLVEGKRLISDANWTVVSEARRGDGNPMTLCLGGATEFRYFRVIEGVTVPPGPPASVPVPNVSLSVDAAFQLCLTWDTLVGAEYFVEGKERASDLVWTVISPILQATGIELSYCQALGSDWRYLQVRRVNTAPEPPVEIEVIEIMPAGLRLLWSGPAGTRYQVFYSDTIPAIWTPIGGAVTSVTGDFQFTDDGSLTAGFPGFRIYRIQRLP